MAGAGTEAAIAAASEVAWYTSLQNNIDGNWIDIGSLLGGFLYALWRNRKQSPRPKLISKVTAYDVANGVGLFPLFLLGMTVLSSKVLHELLAANKLILSIAGVVALLAILDDS